MAQLKVLDVLGKEVKTVEFADSVFSITPHQQSMFDQVLSERASMRQGTHKVKGRSEVRGGGRKPWKQKGTGRARTGSIRIPHWRGGGVVFGPTPNRNYTIKLNKKQVKLAKKSGWSVKFAEGIITLVDDMKFNTPKTQDFKKMLNNISDNTRRILLILEGREEDHNTFLSGKNLPNVVILTPQEVMLYDVLKATSIIATPEAMKQIEGALI